MTHKTYYDDLYLREIDAEVISQTEHDGKYNIILDQTIFYPSGGGQPCDLGFIDDVEVIDVHESGDEIIHVLSAPVENKRVHCVLNWDRRFEFMQQHLGEHLFAGCIYSLHDIHTARMRIEGDNVSIDTDIPADMNKILEAEALANEAIYKNIPVEVIYPDMEEVKANARKLPPENAETPIRIVKVEGVDYVPCCGLHVKSTGEVGLVKVTSVENHKGGSRIYMRCGRAAYRWLASVHEEVRKAESELVCGYDGINEKILSLKSQIHALKVENEKTIERFLKPIAESLLASGEKVIVHVMSNSNQDEAKHLFKLITESNHDAIVLLACETSEGAFIIFGTNKANKKVDVRPAFKKAINILEGRGGGNSFCAQGWGKNPDKLNEALELAKAELM
ncbi:MAG: hypothetical protein IJU48_00545 [Synergistaceae bacterium]|nr:hypothetical protein [Synergistaceae bacterium]